MQRLPLTLTALLSLSTGACSDSGSNGGSTSDGGSSGYPSTAGTSNTDGGSGGSGSGGGDSGGDDSGGSDSGGSGSGAGSPNGGAPGGSGSLAGGTGEGGSGGNGFAFSGVCGQRGEGIVNEDTFTGFEELYMVGEEEVDEGILDIYICAVRFQVNRVGDPPGTCGEFAGQQDECLWSHLVEYSDPEIVTDEDGVCANSELALDEEAITAIDGSQAAYGFVSEYQGHNSVLLKYDAATETWIPNGNATWDPGSDDFEFDRRDGFCDY